MLLYSTLFYFILLYYTQLFYSVPFMFNFTLCSTYYTVFLSTALLPTALNVELWDVSELLSSLREREREREGQRQKEIKVERKCERDLSGKMEHGQRTVCIYCCFLDNSKLCFYLAHVKGPVEGVCVCVRKYASGQVMRGCVCVCVCV